MELGDALEGLPEDLFSSLLAALMQTSAVEEEEARIEHSRYSGASGGVGVAAPSGAAGAAGAAPAAPPEPHPELWAVLLRGAENGYALSVTRALTASAELAHDEDVLAGLLSATATKILPTPRRVREPRVPPLAAPPSLKYATAPLLHAAATLGHVQRVAELLHVGR